MRGREVEVGEEDRGMVRSLCFYFFWVMPAFMESLNLCIGEYLTL